MITRAASKHIEQSENVDMLDGLQDTFLNNSDTDIVNIQNQSCSQKKQLITDQQNDETLTSFNDDLVSICDIDDHDVCYYTKIGILIGMFRPSDAKLYIMCSSTWFPEAIPYLYHTHVNIWYTCNKTGKTQNTIRILK